jgi:hypothetical protein
VRNINDFDPEDYEIVYKERSGVISLRNKAGFSKPIARVYPLNGFDDIGGTLAEALVIYRSRPHKQN